MSPQFLLFPSNPNFKIEILSNPPFLKIWLEVQPPSPQTENKAWQNYVKRLKQI